MGDNWLRQEQFDALMERLRLSLDCNVDYWELFYSHGDGTEADPSSDETADKHNEDLVSMDRDIFINSLEQLTISMNSDRIYEFPKDILTQFPAIGELIIYGGRFRNTKEEIYSRLGDVNRVEFNDVEFVDVPPDHPDVVKGRIYPKGVLDDFFS